jgi:hypothetical protein
MIVPLFGLATAIATAPCDEACAQAILRSARAFVGSRSIPPEIEYDVEVRLLRPDGGSDDRTFHAGYVARDRTIYARAISNEEAAHPVTPHGVTVKVGLQISIPTAGGIGTDAAPITRTFSRTLSRPASDPNVLGTPFLTPTYAFGLGRPSVATSIADGGLRTIGQTESGIREYDARYIDDEMIGGELAHHIALAPRRRSPQARVRELWVAVRDGAPLQARIHGNFTSAPWDGLDWTVTFRRDGDALYLVAETTVSDVELPWKRHGRVDVDFLAIKEGDVRRDFLVRLVPGGAIFEPSER